MKEQKKQEAASRESGLQILTEKPVSGPCGRPDPGTASGQKEMALLTGSQAAEKKQKEEEQPKIQVAAIVGSTGTGKTALAVELARKLNGEIISGDSMQVYRQMDIGTAKATAEEQAAAVHHLIDIQDYDEPYNVKIFQEKCREKIEEIHRRGHLPILCGGTGLYIKAALYDYEFMDEEPNPEARAEFEAMDNKSLVSFLQEHDPRALDKIHPNNRKRLIRACMIASTPTRKSDREEKQKHEPLYDVFFIGLKGEKELTEKRIEKRVDQMFEAGLPEEVRSLFSDPQSWEYTSFQGIGYKEFRGWLQGEKDLSRVREEIIIHTRQYAKRQVTWFRNQMPVTWFDLSEKDQVLPAVEKWRNRHE